MWIALAGMLIFSVGTIVLLMLLSPKDADRPRLFTCQRCGTAFGSPPLHPLPKRYQEEDVCLCKACGGELEEQVREVVRETLVRWISPAAGDAPTTGAPDGR